MREPGECWSNEIKKIASSLWHRINMLESTGGGLRVAKRQADTQ